jgi:PAS domain S-box-containing protein
MQDRSILIVEDEAIIAMDLRQQLEGLGYRVVGVAESAEQAFEMVRKHNPSLTLMDIRLKGPLDGIEAAAIFSRRHRVPVVFLTSHTDEMTVQRAADTAAYGYVTKPFRIGELRAAIEIALVKSGMEARLRDADRWFAATLRCVHDGIVVTDNDARVKLLNPAAELLLGTTVADAAGRGVTDVVRFVAVDGARSTANAAVRALDEGRVIGIDHARRLLGRGGNEVPVDQSAGPIDDEEGRRLGAVLVLRDARERMRREADLRTSEQRFRSAFDNAPLGMALVALDGRFLQVNGALARLLQADPISLLDLRQDEVTPAEDHKHESQRLQELLAGDGAVTQFEKRYRQRSGELIWALVSVSVLRDHGLPTCLLYQVHDLTGQKQAAEQLAQLAAERLRAEASEAANRMKGEFISRASHEMRTPLNAVLGFAQLLQAQADLSPEKTKHYAAHITQSGQHLLAMVNDLLDLQRAAGGQLVMRMEPLDAAQAVREVLRMLAPMAAEQQVSFESELAPGIGVIADPTRLRQVLLNLGSNAIKYNRPGGKVPWRVASAADPARVQIVVADSGIGMTPEQVTRLFQPFERLGQEGSAIPGAGLGLVIVRSLVEQMGGTIELTSTPREGTQAVLDFAAG